MVQQTLGPIDSHDKYTCVYIYTHTRTHLLIQRGEKKETGKGVSKKNIQVAESLKQEEELQYPSFQFIPKSTRSNSEGGLNPIMISCSLIE